MRPESAASLVVGNRMIGNSHFGASGRHVRPAGSGSVRSSEESASFTIVGSDRLRSTK
jgi:hypothetical protein